MRANCSPLLAQLVGDRRPADGLPEVVADSLTAQALARARSIPGLGSRAAHSRRFAYRKLTGRGSRLRASKLRICRSASPRVTP